MNRMLTIGKLADATGCNKETIRYYEKIGIVPPPARTEGGHRQYDAEAEMRLFFIRRCRELGFTLDRIRQLLALVDGRAYSCAEVNSLTLDHLATIRNKIVDLKKMERALRDMAQRCSGDATPQCAIIDTLYGGRKE